MRPEFVKSIQEVYRLQDLGNNTDQIRQPFKQVLPKIDVEKVLAIVPHPAAFASAQYPAGGAPSPVVVDGKVYRDPNTNESFWIEHRSFPGGGGVPGLTGQAEIATYEGKGKHHCPRFEQYWSTRRHHYGPWSRQKASAISRVANSLQRHVARPREALHSPPTHSFKPCTRRW